MQDLSYELPRTHLLRLSEKGYEQRSNREFGRHAGHEIGQKGLLRTP
jgi:hypothetical protein